MCMHLYTCIYDAYIHFYIYVYMHHIYMYINAYTYISLYVYMHTYQMIPANTLTKRFDTFMYSKSWISTPAFRQRLRI